MYRIFYLFILIIYSNVTVAALVNGIDIDSKSGKTIITIKISSAFNYTAFSLTRPDRVVVDINDAKLAIATSSIKTNNSVIKKIRSSNGNKRLRLVFDLKSNQKMKSMRLKPKGNNNFLSVQLSQDEKIAKKVIVKPKKLRPIVIILDPGHGGKDPGAIGRQGAREKAITLKIAKKLKYYINKQQGMRAYLTRKGDYYVGLRQRLAIARKKDANIFISIHADAFKNRRSNGASVFALSQRGATSEAARWIAEKENYSELGGVNLSELKDKSGLVRSVLIDLSQTATIGSSLALGQRVLGFIDNITNLHHDKVEQARFVVLKSPDIPSILIETGFISNPKEEKNLNSSRYQRRIAWAVFKGLTRYFAENPPPGTYFSAQMKSKSYRVTRGDTLSKIALNYDVSVSKLMKENRLHSEKLKIGQVLSIPISRS
jgi:N-acetylmuramoyl-L-alanine amidase